jgi:hypothetical protein
MNGIHRPSRMLPDFHTQVAIDERRHVREKQIQQVQSALARTKAEAAERSKQIDLEKFQGL